MLLLLIATAVVGALSLIFGLQPKPFTTTSTATTSTPTTSTTPSKFLIFFIKTKILYAVKITNTLNSWRDRVETMSRSDLLKIDLVYNRNLSIAKTRLINSNF
jgi:hypothetical protein